MQDPLASARLHQPSGQLVEAVTRSRLESARQVFHEHMQVNKAHALMLAEREILTPDQGAKILALLSDIEALGPGRFPMDPKLGPFIEQLEKYLSDRVGEDIAGRLHTGRSYIDYDAAVGRLVARNRLLSVLEHVVGFAGTVLEVAGRHVETVMPGFTDLQHAQPWTFGHYLLGYFSVFERDLQRLAGAFSRTNLSSLGGAALAGTSWPLDRARVAELLGHDGVVVNAHDAGETTADVPCENAAALSILMNNLGRLAGDLYVWSSWEFRLVELADEFCGTSSIMPQKKNPYALGVVRGLAGQAIGWLPWMQGIFKSATSSDLDYAYVGDIITTASETSVAATDLMRGALSTLSVNTKLMQERAGANWATASHLADEIVRKYDLSVRTAHRIVARMVRIAVEQDISPQRVTGAILDSAAVQTVGRKLNLPDDFVAQALDPTRFVQSRATMGSIHPDEVRIMLAAGVKRLAAHRSYVTTVKTRIASAHELLTSRVKAIVG